MLKRVILGSDHAGIALKNSIKEYIRSLNIEVVDVGTD
jgi:ribose 5-phosphate isomerase RpiB